MAEPLANKAGGFAVGFITNQEAWITIPASCVFTWKN